MKLNEITSPRPTLFVQKAGSQSGAEALQAFFAEMQQDSDALDMFIDKMIAVGGGVVTYGVPFLTFYIQPDRAGYSVRVRLETEDVSALVVGKDMPDGTSADFDSPVETYVTFHLPAQAAIEVALSDEDQNYDMMERLLELAGGFIHRVEKEFGQTPEYAQQMREE
jgi:hypothetical protein